MGNKKERKKHTTQHAGEVGGIAHQRNMLAVKAEAALSDQLLPGRHPCKCQARIHALIRNCMGCGKIICMQEGSGPCFFCGTFVCTKQEKEILDRGSRKSIELYNQLMGAEKHGGDKNFLSSISAEFQEATQFRNKLLAADADSERRTRVNDLESDYSCIETNPYLTAEEREVIKQRRLELQEIHEKRRRNIVVNINVGDMSVTEGNREPGTAAMYDPVIESIIDKSEERRRAIDATKNSAVDAQWIPKGFVPKYDQSCGNRHESNVKEFADVDALCMMNEELGRLEVERRGYAITLPQPYASLVSHGVLNEDGKIETKTIFLGIADAVKYQFHMYYCETIDRSRYTGYLSESSSILYRYIRWFEDISLKGPVVICSAVAPITNKEVSEVITKCQLEKSIIENMNYCTGSIQGRAYVSDCITYNEYNREIDAHAFGSGDFVLIFSSFEPLNIPVPYIPPAPFFRLENEILHILRNVFGS